MTVAIHEAEQHAALAVVPDMASDPTGGRLVAWAAGLSAAHQIGSALCQTSFVPQHFRNKPDEAAAAILLGDEIGFTPTQALQNIFVISGKPALYARAMVALTLAAGHAVWTVEKTDTKVTVCGQRRGSDHAVTETWTYERAKRAGYTSNKKYETDPQSMLYARAAADVCRQVAPDALAGLAYSAEELELTPGLRESAPVRSVASFQTSGPVEPAGDAPPASTAPGPEPDPMVTGAQLSKLGVQFRELGITERSAALELVADVVGRPVESRNQLTRVEASRLVEYLSLQLGELPEPEGPEADDAD